MLHKETAGSRIHSKLDEANKDLARVAELFKHDDGHRSAKTVSKRLKIKESLEMFVEDFLGHDHDVSNESFKETIIKGFEAIVEKLKKILIYVIDFFKTFMATNIKNTENLVRRLSSDPKIKLSKSLLLESVNLLGYGYTNKLEGKSTVTLRKFVSPISTCLPVSTEILRSTHEINNITHSKVTKDKVSQISAKVNTVVKNISAMNVENIPKIDSDNGKISFNRENTAKKFSETYPREESSCIINVPMFLSSFSSYKSDVNMATNVIRDYDNFIKDLKKATGKISKGEVDSDSSFSANDLMVQLIKISSIAMEFQKYFMESLNQSVRFNNIVVKALAREYLTNSLNVSDDGISGSIHGVKISIESTGEEIPVISALAVSDSDDERLDVDNEVIEIEPPADIILELDEDIEEVSLENFPMTIDNSEEKDSSKFKEGLKKTVDKIIEVAKKVYKWIREKIFSVVSMINKTLDPLNIRLEKARALILLTSFVKSRSITLDFTGPSAPYGVFDNTGKLIPDQIKQRTVFGGNCIGDINKLLRSKTFEELDLLEMSDDKNSFKLLKEIGDSFSSYIQTFKNTGIEVEFDLDDIPIPRFTVSNTNTSDSVEIKSVSLKELASGVGGQTGFTGIKRTVTVLDQTVTKLKSIHRYSARIDISKTLGNKLRGISSDDLNDIHKSLRVVREVTSRSLKILSFILQSISKFTDSLSRVGYEVFTGKLYDGAEFAAMSVKDLFKKSMGKESFEELEMLKSSISESIDRGGLNMHEARAVNVSSVYLKNTFGIEDFEINPELFIDPSHRKDFTELYLDKLSSI